MKFSGIFMILILFLYQPSEEGLDDANDMFTFILVFFGIILLIIILVYIYLTSKQE